jgi:hypothetical protein
MHNSSVYGLGQSDSVISGSKVLYIQDGSGSIMSRDAGNSIPLNGINETKYNYLCIDGGKLIRIANDGYRPKGEKYWDTSSTVSNVNTLYNNTYYKWCLDSDLSYEIDDDSVVSSVACSSIVGPRQNSSGIWYIIAKGTKYEKTSYHDEYGNVYYERSSTIDFAWYYNAYGPQGYTSNQVIKLAQISTQS